MPGGIRSEAYWSRAARRLTKRPPSWVTRRRCANGTTPISCGGTSGTSISIIYKPKNYCATLKKLPLSHIYEKSWSRIGLGIPFMELHRCMVDTLERRIPMYQKSQEPYCCCQYCANPRPDLCPVRRMNPGSHERFLPSGQIVLRVAPHHKHHCSSPDESPPNHPKYGQMLRIVYPSRHL